MSIFTRNTAPKDGKSYVNPVLAKILRPVNKAIVHTLWQVDLQGEPIPENGKDVLCPTHQSYFDANVVGMLSGRDMRFMAAKEEFIGLRGIIMRNAGAFPVDRAHVSPTTLRHAADMLSQDKLLVVFPEGGIEKKPPQVQPAKPGVGWIMATAGAESAVPIAIHFDKAPEKKMPVLARIGLAAAGIGLGVAASSVGGAGIVLGGLGGAWAMTCVGEKLLNLPKIGTLVAGATFGTAGLIAGGIVGGMFLGHAPIAAAVAGLLAGHAAAQGINAYRNRDVLKINVGKKIEIAPYLTPGVKKKDAAIKFMADVDKELVRLKTAIAGPEAGAWKPPTPPAPTPQPAPPAAPTPQPATAAASPAPAPAPQAP